MRHGDLTSYPSVRERCEAFLNTLAHGENYIFHEILDFIVDNYRPVVQAVRADVEVLEDDVLRGTPKQADIGRLYGLRRDLSRLRGAIVPLVKLCSELEHAETMATDPTLGPLFRDITDHVRRMQEETDTLREVLTLRSQRLSPGCTE